MALTAGDRVKRARLKRDLTLAALAERAGLHLVTIAEIEADRMVPGATAALRLAAALDLPLDRLWPGAGRDPLPPSVAAAIADGANAVTALAAHRGLDQRGLAAAAGLSPQMVSRIVRGQATPSIASLIKLARATRVSADALGRALAGALGDGPR